MVPSLGCSQQKEMSCVMAPRIHASTWLSETSGVAATKIGVTPILWRRAASQLQAWGIAEARRPTTPQLQESMHLYASRGKWCHNFEDPLAFKSA